MPYDIDEESLFLRNSVEDRPRVRVSRSRRRACHLTDDIVRDLPLVAGKDYYVFDDVCTCFAVRVRDGRKAYYFQPQRRQHVKSVNRMIRPLGLSCDEARSLAQQMSLAYRGGTEERFEDLSLAEAFSRYELGCKKSRYSKKAHTLVKAHVLPDHGARVLSSLRRRDLERILTPPVPGQRLLHKKLKTLFNWCVDHDLMDTNPLARRPLPSTQGRRDCTYLAAGDIAMIYFAAREMPEPWRVMVPFLILTGASASELRTLKRDDIDWMRGEYQSKTSRSIPGPCEPLSELAVQVLSEASGDSELLFPSPRRNNWRGMSLRPSILRELQRLSGTSRWSWYDLTKSVRSRMAAIRCEAGPSPLNPVDPTWQQRARATANAWAAALPAHRDRVLALRLDDAEIVL